MWPNKQVKLHMKNNQQTMTRKHNRMRILEHRYYLFRDNDVHEGILITRRIAHEEDDEEEAKRVKHIFSLWIANNP